MPSIHKIGPHVRIRSRIRVRIRNPDPDPAPLSPRLSYTLPILAPPPSFIYRVPNQVCTWLETPSALSHDVRNPAYGILGSKVTGGSLVTIIILPIKQTNVCLVNKHKEIW